MKEFSYYVYIDYSERLLGYSIIAKEKIKEILPKITKLKHYKEVKNRKLYIQHIKNYLEKNNVASYFLKIKIRKVQSNNLEIYSDVLEFLKKNKDCLIFVSVDNNQYDAFRKLVSIVDGCNKIIKESELKRESIEYQLSLVLDNLLNIERKKS